MVVQRNNFVKITYLFVDQAKKTRKGVGSVRESPTGLIHVIFDMRNLESSEGFGLGGKAWTMFQ